MTIRQMLRLKPGQRVVADLDRMREVTFKRAVVTAAGIPIDPIAIVEDGGETWEVEPHDIVRQLPGGTP